MPWKSGQSGNPKGRPRTDHEVVALAKLHTQEALEALVRIATEGQSESAVVSAATAILDRGWGRPHQTSDVNIRRTEVTRLTDDDLDRAITAALARGEAAEEPSGLTH